MLNKPLFLIIAFYLSAMISFSQNTVKTCGTDQVLKEALQKNPALIKLLQSQDSLAKEYTKQHYGEKSGAVKIIPVVIHVIHTYGPENVSKAQVLDAIRIINEDFRNLNADTADVIPAFKSIVADSEIEFRLAKIDPNGNCTEGITRTYSPLTHSAGENVKDLISWNTAKYLNVWVVANIESGAGAYAYYPGTAPQPSHEGIVCRASQFGSIGASNGGNFSSRTLTHEIGHYLNLAHTWGSTNTTADPSNCSSDDGVSDTPNTIGSNLNCDLNQTTCSSLDNVQNYMDYATCTKMFTQGQKARMQAALNSSVGSRNNLWTSSNLIATGTNDGYTPVTCAPTADFDASTYRICAGESITFTDLSYNAPKDNSWSYNWSFPGGTPSSSTDSMPTIVYNTPGVYDVSLTVTNSAGSNSYTRNQLIIVKSNSNGGSTPFFEGFEDTSFPTNSTNNNLSWEYDFSTSTAWDRTTIASVSGNASLVIDNKNIAEGMVNSFISPSIDFSNVTTSGVMTFNVAYAQTDNSSTDLLRVLFSKDCGKSWQVRYARSGAQLASVSPTSGNFIPTSTNQWQEFSIPLAIFAGESSIYIKFEMTSGGGNKCYIDDINIQATTGIEELINTDQIQVYPNPSKGNVTIKLNSSIAVKTNIQILDISGRVILNKPIQLSQKPVNIIDENRLIPGTYFVNITAGNKKWIKKLVIIN
jgi:PKD repeat protein